VVSGLKTALLIITFRCVDERLQKTWDGCLSARDNFCWNFEKRFWSNVPSNHSNFSHQAQLTTFERFQMQKENALTEQARWKRSARLETSIALKWE